MKKALLILVLIHASVFITKAQIGYNFPQWSLGTGISQVTAKTSVLNQSSHGAFNFNVSYNVTPYVAVTLDYQFGQLSGGYNEYYAKAVSGLSTSNIAQYDSLLLAIPTAYSKTDPYHLSYFNDFQMINVHADVQLGEFMDYASDNMINKIVRNIYVGTGIGMVFNSISGNNNRLTPDSTYYIGGSDNSQNVVIPLRFGYQFKLYNNYDMPSVLIELGYQHNWVLGYGLDGFADPLVLTHRFEQFSGFHVGVKFNFGNITSYRRPIH